MCYSEYEKHDDDDGVWMGLVMSVSVHYSGQVMGSLL